MRLQICTYLGAMAESLEAPMVELLNQRGILVPGDELAELTRAYQTLLDLERVLETMTTTATEPAFIPSGDPP